MHLVSRCAVQAFRLSKGKSQAQLRRLVCAYARVYGIGKSDTEKLRELQTEAAEAARSLLDLPLHVSRPALDETAASESSGSTTAQAIRSSGR
jgi:hypothetical protein